MPPGWRPDKGTVESARSAARLTMPMIVRGRWQDLEALKILSLETLVSVRNHVDWSIESRGKEICLLFHSKEISMPDRVEEALHFIRDTSGPFSAAHLPDSLNESGRIVLVKRLVRE